MEQSQSHMLKNYKTMIYIIMHSIHGRFCISHIDAHIEAGKYDKVELLTCTLTKSTANWQVERWKRNLGSMKDIEQSVQQWPYQMTGFFLILPVIKTPTLDILSTSNCMYMHPVPFPLCQPNLGPFRGTEVWKDIFLGSGYEQVTSLWWLLYKCSIISFCSSQNV